MGKILGSDTRLRPARMTRAALLAALLPALMGGQGYYSDVNTRILTAHNYERSILGLNPVRWNPQLAKGAKEWADNLARTERFQHAPRSRGAKPLGENLWAGTRGYFQPEVMVGHWIDEKRYFKAGRFPAVSKTGRFSDVGHYTQIIWRDTSEVGCAISSNVRDDILVCRYARAGNVMGQRPF